MALRKRVKNILLLIDRVARKVTELEKAVADLRAQAEPPTLGGTWTGVRVTPNGFVAQFPLTAEEVVTKGTHDDWRDVPYDPDNYKDVKGMKGR
jgi:hypothetical protein